MRNSAPALAATAALTLIAIGAKVGAQDSQAPWPRTQRTSIAPPAFMPDAAGSKIVSVARTGRASRRLVIVTEAVAVKESGPAATIKRFGEVYAFSPATLIVRQNEPTQISFWNLQPDDQHDFSIVDASGRPLMDLRLAPLSLTSYTFTFHRPGIMQFRCLVHQPEMSGQVLVLPAP